MNKITGRRMSISVFNRLAKVNYQHLRDPFLCGNLAKFSLVRCFEENGSVLTYGVISLKTSDNKHCSDVNVISIAANSVFVSHNLGDVNVYGKSISHHQSTTSERKVRVVVFFF